MIEFDVDMGYLLEYGELDCVVLNDENGEHEPMEFMPKAWSGTCEIESEFWHDFGGEGSDTYEFVLSCGHSVEWLDSEPPRHCPDCGRVVER